MSSIVIPDTLVITKDGKPASLFMSFGLLNELLVVVGHLEQVSMILIDHELRTKVLVSVLSERNPKGDIVSEFSPFNSNVPTKDIQAICEWVGSHCLDFFLEAIETAIRTHLPQKARMEGVAPSTLSGTGIPA